MDEDSRMEIESEEIAGRMMRAAKRKTQVMIVISDCALALHVHSLLTTGFWVLARACPLP